MALHTEAGSRIIQVVRLMGGGRRTAPGGPTYDHDRMGGPVTDPMVRGSHLFGTVIALGLVLATILALGFIAMIAWVALHGDF
jgi:hypothetical protein